MNPLRPAPSKRPMPARAAATMVLLALGMAALGLSAVGSAWALDVGRAMPELGLPDLRGQRVEARGLRGKVVLVDFWASWCEPCREEMPVLERLHRRFRQRGLVVLGVSVDRERENVDSFLRRAPVTFRIVHDGRHQIADRFAPPRMPSSYLIDRRGVVRYVHAGYRAADARVIEREVEALVREPASTR